MGGSKAAAAGSSPAGQKTPLRVLFPLRVREAFEKASRKKIIGSIVLASSFALPTRRPHTTLKKFKQQYQSVTWVIEADISKCFDSIPYEVILDCVSKRVACTRFPAMVKRSPETRYIDRKGNLNKLSRVGTPSGLTHLMNRKWVSKLPRSGLGKVRSAQIRRCINYVQSRTWEPE